MKTSALERVTELEKELAWYYEAIATVCKEANFDLTPAQALIIARIGDRGCSRSEMPYAGTNPAYNIDKLERDGLLRRDRQCTDRRKVHIVLTEKGRAVKLSVARAFTMPAAKEMSD